MTKVSEVALGARVELLSKRFWRVMQPGGETHHSCDDRSAIPSQSEPCKPSRAAREGRGPLLNFFTVLLRVRGGVTTREDD